ncbi:hypothetical protein L7F22_026991 [Adiantum nelumboides]|nr:hypothetical protein [Adiantum nelumboides]
MPKVFNTLIPCVSQLHFPEFLKVTLWILVPHMISSGDLGSITTVLFTAVVCQFVPKVLHIIYLARSIRHVIGIVFGAVWWGFALNLTAYLVAAHVAGACWYLLAIQRVVVCMLDRSKEGSIGSLKFMGCHRPITYQAFPLEKAASSAINLTTLSLCFRQQDTQGYNYGIFQWAIPLLTGRAWSTKLLYPLFWGLMTLSSFGNALQPSDNSLEVLFSIAVITCGLLLFSLLIGNIQVFLHAITAKNEAMKLRLRDLERWMRRRQLPSRLRHRVRRYERHHWAATRGVNEGEMIDCLPEGLRRDIKQQLSLDLVRQVPLFERMDNLVLKNICERLKPHLYVKDELVIREGDPVQRMIFIVRGHLLSSHALSNGDSSVCCLGPGNFCGDELLTWCLKRPFVERLPPSFATLKSVDVTEAFGLEAQDFKFVTEHFRYKFINENLKRTARYYSSGWRTWAAVSIQLAWRRYQVKKAKLPTVEAVEMSRSLSERDPIRLYAAMFSSHKPQDNLQ